MKSTIGLFAFLVLALVAYSSLFIVDETQQALVLQFGEPKQVIQTPGLKTKLPLIQNVAYYDKRILELDPNVEAIIMADQKRLEVDSYARYRIHDPLAFRKAVGNERAAAGRLGAVINASIRRVLGNITMAELLSGQRIGIMEKIRDEVDSEAKRFGIEVVDVRIRRADLPDEVSQQTYQRMRSEREREAKQFRAEGEEQANQITSRADKERSIILAEAQKEAEIIRGEGDGQAIQIYADAFNRDKNFYEFYRSMQAYKKALDKDTTFILSPESDFLHYLKKAP